MFFQLFFSTILALISGYILGFLIQKKTKLSSTKLTIWIGILTVFSLVVLGFSFKYSINFVASIKSEIDVIEEQYKGGGKVDMQSIAEIERDIGRLNHLTKIPFLGDLKNSLSTPIKDFHTVKGLLYLQENNMNGARKQLDKLRLIHESRYITEPTFVLACKLLEHNDKDVVHGYLRHCRAYYDKRKRDASSRRISTWILTLEQNEFPDLGDYCNFK